ncbi:head decoration protein [Pseudoalteromonas rubra]|uniref:head decoration protein n=1 Tax=Pseudoalteromonas rubra TaxID=43658 RepID=UPI000F76C256|nr:head decoration protein [Pseudoalteromonas rubra]
MTTTHMRPRAGTHVAGELNHVSRDGIVVVGGPYSSGTVLGKNDDDTYTQLNIAADATEATTAEIVLYDHIDSAEDTPAVGHARVCALYASKLIWPDGITAVQKEDAVTALAKNQVVLR